MRPEDYRDVRDGVLALDDRYPLALTGDDLSAEAEDAYRDTTTARMLAAIDVRIEIWQAVRRGRVAYMVRLLIRTGASRPAARHSRARRLVAIAG